MNDNAFTPRRIIDALEVLLAQLSATLAPVMNEDDSRTDNLKNRISGYQDQAARLKTVLTKHQEAERRKRELTKQNKLNTKAPGK